MSSFQIHRILKPKAKSALKPKVASTTNLYDFKALEHQLGLSLDTLNKFYKNIEDIPVQPDVKPGFLYNKLKSDLPLKPVPFENTLKEFEKDFLPNMTQWQHPKFFAYFPAPISHTTITAETIATALNTPNFNWNVSQSAHELEWTIAHWMVKMLGLPDKFLFENGGAGGVAGSTTEAAFLSVNQAVERKIKELNLDIFDSRRLKFVGYYPETNKNWAEKALHIKGVNIKRKLKVHYDEGEGNYKVDPEELYKQIKEDIKDGLVPVWYGGQIGATDCGAKDDLEVIGPIVREHNIYLNLDCAWAGMFFLLPECRVKGLNYANNICINMVKAGLGGLQSSLMFNDGKEDLVSSTGNIDGRIYKCEDNGIQIDYKDFQVGFGRRLVGFKIYMLLRTIGLEGYQEYLRNIIARQEYFHELVKTNKRLELFTEPEYGLVNFRLKPSGKNPSVKDYNMINEQLINVLKDNSEMGYISSSIVDEKRFMRFVSAQPLTEEHHISSFWDFLCETTEKLRV